MESSEVAKKSILSEILNYFIEHGGNFPDIETFRLKHRKNISLIEEMNKQGLIWCDPHKSRDEVYLKISGLLLIESDVSRNIIKNANALIPVLQKMLDEDHSLLKKDISIADLAQKINKDTYEVEIAFYFLHELTYLGFRFSGGVGGKSNSRLSSYFKIEDGIFSINSIEEAVEKYKIEQKLKPEPVRGLSITEYFGQQSYSQNTNYNLEQPPDFGKLTSNVKMQGILIRRWNECEKCVRGDIPLAATVMVGAFIETLLVVKWNLARPSIER